MQSVKLKDFQIQPVAKLCSLAYSNALLTCDLSEQGVGKTYHAVALIQNLLTLGIIKHVAIVCPSGVRTEWKAVLKKHGIEPLFIHSYETVSQGKTEWFSTSKTSTSGAPTWFLPENCLLIFDEAHKMRGVNSAMSKLAIAARNAIKKTGLRVHLMTGTLATTPKDLYALGYLLGLHKLFDFGRWAKDHGCYEGIYGLEYNSKSDGMEHIHGKISAFSVRLRKNDIPNFPKKRISLVKLSDDRNLIQAEIDKAIEKIAKTQNKGELINRNFANAALVRHAIELGKVPQTCELALDELEKGNAVIWFLNFNDSFELAFELLYARQKKVSKVRGGQTDKKRDAEKAVFQSGAGEIILVNTQAGGTGINLQDETGDRPRVSLCYLTHRVIDLLQAMDRAHRATAMSDCEVKIILADVGPEKKMHSAVQKKIDNIGTLNDGEIVGPMTDYVDSALGKCEEEETEFSLGGTFNFGISL